MIRNTNNASVTEMLVIGWLRMPNPNKTKINAGIK
jgi:hypothetical protein